MKEFGYLKIASTLYCLMMLLSMIMNTKAIIVTITYIFLVIVVFYFFQKYFYKPETIKAEQYDIMFFKSFKDIFSISLVFTFISIGINLILAASFFLISQTNPLKQLLNITPTLLTFLMIFVSLIVSNFIFYHFNYKKELLLHTEEQEHKPVNQKLVLKNKTDDSSEEIVEENQLTESAMEGYKEQEEDKEKM